MSTIKNIPQQYTVNVPEMTVNGNLTVTGNSTNVYTDNLSVADNIITVNAGEAGAGVSLIYSGIEVDRGSLANVQVRWNETYKHWQISNDGTTYSNIATTSGSGSSLTAVVQDPTPALGGNLNITNHTIYSNNGSVQIFANTAGSGGSGVYVTNTDTTGAELVTKAKAVAYSIVFG